MVLDDLLVLFREVFAAVEQEQSCFVESLGLSLLDFADEFFIDLLKVSDCLVSVKNT